MILISSLLLFLAASVASQDDPLQDVYTCKNNVKSSVRILLISYVEEYSFGR